MKDYDRRARHIEHPVIGLTTYLQRAQTGVWDVQAGLLPHVYFDGVARAGGIATLLPPQPVDARIAARVMGTVDALVLTGGKDLDPATYGQDRHPETDEPGPDRDAWELALLRVALDRGTPVLAICRGIQVLNVAFGGTLHQHLPDVLGHSRHRAGNAVFSTTEVAITPGTRLAALLGDRTEVQCYHHQGIDRVGEGLVASARDADGLVEAVEVDGESFVVGVQWHPEERLDDLRLFTAVTDAARTQMAATAAVDV